MMAITYWKRAFNSSIGATGFIIASLKYLAYKSSVIPWRWAQRIWYTRQPPLLHGTQFGVEILIEKNLPSGGGLGGGSSDAATTLVALNQMFGLGFTDEQLQTLALTLGADVPVFIFGQSCFASVLETSLSKCIGLADRF